MGKKNISRFETLEFKSHPIVASIAPEMMAFMSPSVFEKRAEKEFSNGHKISVRECSDSPGYYEVAIYRKGFRGCDVLDELKTPDEVGKVMKKIKKGEIGKVIKED